MPQSDGTMRGESTSASSGRKHRSCHSLPEKTCDEASRATLSPAVYRDFALVPVSDIIKIVEPPKAKRKGPRGGVQTPFPTRLFDMLQAAHEEGLESIVSWQSHGRSFIVRKPTQFETRLLPRFFAQSKMSSFQRQLNLYGFMRQNTGPDRGSYYHELFMKGRPDLPKIMVRTRVKGIGMGRTNKIEKEPDFYVMTPSVHKDSVVATTTATTTTTTTTTPSEEATRDHTTDEEEVLDKATPTTPYALETEGSDRAAAFAVPQAPKTSRRTSVPPIEWIHPVVGVHQLHPSFAPVVTPMAEDGGRPLFDPGNHDRFAEMAASIADPRVPSYVHSHPQHPHPGNHHNSLVPIRSISAQELPMIPMTAASNHDFPPLRPRYSENQVDTRDTGIFEGLEFQVVDDDSLEQFESELISDGTESL